MNAKAIRSLRMKNHWSQQELATRLGTDHVTVSRWERGVSRPRPSARARLTELLNPIPDDIGGLINRTGKPEAISTLKRLVLLNHRLPRKRFVKAPTTRLREVDRLLKEQMDLRARTRVGR